MLKVRLMGTKNDIVWFQKILQRHPKVEVLEISELYSNKGTNKYYRAYAEVQKSNVNSPNSHNRDRYSICGGRNGVSSDRKSTRLNSSHSSRSRMPSSA